MTRTDLTDDDVAELRPSGRSYARAVLPLVPLGVIGALLRLRGQGDSLTIGLMVIGAVALVVVAIVLWYAHTDRVWCDDHAVYRRNMLGRTQIVRRDEIASVLLATRYQALNRPEASLLALVDSGGRTLMRLLGTLWAADDITTFLEQAALGPVVRIDELVSPHDLREDHGGALPYSDRRPVRFVLLVFAGTIAAGVLLVIVAVLLSLASGSA